MPVSYLPPTQLAHALQLTHVPRHEFGHAGAPIRLFSLPLLLLEAEGRLAVLVEAGLEAALQVGVALQGGGEVSGEFFFERLPEGKGGGGVGGGVTVMREGAGSGDGATRGRPRRPDSDGLELARADSLEGHARKR